MGTKRPGRSWPYPRRIRSEQHVDAKHWDALARICDLDPRSADATALRRELAGLIASIGVTLDGRLVTEAPPKPSEIRDPLAHEGIPAALGLAKYLANIDVVSIDRLLREGYETAVRGRGLSPDEPLEQRAHALTLFALSLRTLIPAMIHVANTTDEHVAGGRPAAPRRETHCLLVELATLWARFAEAEWDRFPTFAAEFFSAIGVAAPSRQLCAAAREDAGDLDPLTDEQLGALRRRYARERAQLRAGTETWTQIRSMVSAYAEQGWTAAKEMGWPVDGEAATWREQVRETVAPRSSERSTRRRRKPARRLA